MPIIYNKLFYMLIDLGMKKKDLQEKANITASIMARLARNSHGAVYHRKDQKEGHRLHLQGGKCIRYMP